MKSDVPQGYIKVGRLRQTIAKAIGRKCADIFISNYAIKHIKNNHGKELQNLGISPVAYVKMIISGYNEILEGKNNAILLVRNEKEKTPNVAVIGLTFVVNENAWMIITAQPRRKEHLDKMKKLWRKGGAHSSLMLLLHYPLNLQPTKAAIEPLLNKGHNFCRQKYEI